MRRKSRRNQIAIAVLSVRKGPDGKPYDLTMLEEMNGRNLTHLFMATLTEDEKIAVRVLCRGRTPSGEPFDLDALNRGRKGVAELFEEVRNGEANLYFGPDSRQVKRYAISLKIFIRVLDYWLCQTERRYRNGESDKKREDFAVTETRMRGEEFIAVAIRGLLQELKLKDIGNKDFHLASYFNQRMDVHTSKAYAGIVSTVLVNEVLLSFPTRPKAIQRGAKVKDGSVTIIMKWFKPAIPLVNVKTFAESSLWKRWYSLPPMTTEGMEGLAEKMVGTR